MGKKRVGVEIWLLRNLLLIVFRKSFVKADQNLETELFAGHIALRLKILKFSAKLLNELVI